VIYPGVDVRTFVPDPAARAEDPTIFCGADIAEPRKRVGLLVEAFALVRRERPNARLLLSRPRNEAAAQEWSAREEEGIELVDVDDRDALARTYARAWVSALPSVGEAFGLVLLEAMACGTPVVGSNLGAIPEVVSDEGIGRLFDGTEPQALAGALLETLALAEAPETPAACRAHAEQFSTDRTAEAHLELYGELLAGR
jgi:glycosyltransferase involved in cell wall biosynthesis